MGYEPHYVSMMCGKAYDIESSVSESMHAEDAPVLRMIEVKGLIAGGDSVTLSKNEIHGALNVGGQRRLLVARHRGGGRQDHIHAISAAPALTAPSFAEANRSSI